MITLQAVPVLPVELPTFSQAEQWRLIASYGGWSIYVPNEREAECVKKLVQQGHSVATAYGSCWLPHRGDPLIARLPYTVFHPCLSDVYKVPSPFSYEAIKAGYGACLLAHVLGAETVAGRVQIRPGLMAPSQQEESCIRASVFQTGLGIEAAYAACGAGDIYKAEIGACILEDMWQSNESLYGITKRCWNEYLTTLPPPPPTHAPPDIPPPEDKDNTILYIAAALGIALLLR